MTIMTEPVNFKISNSNFQKHSVLNRVKENYIQCLYISWRDQNLSNKVGLTNGK